MNIDFIRDIHNKEFERKERLAQRANSIIAGMTTLWGVIGFVFVNYKSHGHSVDTAFWILAVISGLLLLTVGFNLIRSYRVPPLNDIAKPKEWLSYWTELKQKYETGKGTQESAETEFTDYLLKLYADIGDDNIEANFNRGTFLVKSNNYLLGSFVLIVMTSLTFYLNNYILQEETIPKGVNKMFIEKDTYICVPATRCIGGNGGPGKRPVPDPSPDPENVN